MQIKNFLRYVHEQMNRVSLDETIVLKRGTKQEIFSRVFYLHLQLLKFLRKSAASAATSSKQRNVSLVLCLLTCFSGGVFLATCFLHLFPELKEHLSMVCRLHAPFLFTSVFIVFSLLLRNFFPHIKFAFVLFFVN